MDIRKQFSIQGLVEHWNKLPLVIAPSLTGFKKCLDMVRFMKLCGAGADFKILMCPFQLKTFYDSNLAQIAGKGQ